MSFLRPEAQETLLRYREALVGVALLLLGMWWALTALGLLRWVALAIIVLGAFVLWSGLRHARIRTGKGGVGVVQIDERRVTYLAPVGGGFASLDDITGIDIARDRAGFAVWRFHTGPERLTIPVRAEGAEAIFDALTALSGADIDAAIRAANSPPDDVTVIWGNTYRLLH